MNIVIKLVSIISHFLASRAALFVQTFLTFEMKRKIVPLRTLDWIILMRYQSIHETGIQKQTGEKLEQNRNALLN